MRFDVVGIGENSIDRVYRLPVYPRPDSATSKVRISGSRASPGGQVATTLCTCAALGLRAGYVGSFGNDDNGARIRRELAARHVDVSTAVIRDAPNRHALILVAEPHGERVVLWERDARLTFAPKDLPAEWLAQSRLVHVDDVDEAASIAAARVARDASVPVTSDVDRVTERTAELVALSTTPIFSEHALRELTGESDPERGLRMVRRDHSGLLSVTCGARGAFVLAGRDLHYQPAYSVEVVDTTGAGDVFRGALIYALLRGDEPRELLRFATAAAAVSCTRLGAIESVPTLAEVKRRLIP